MKFSASLVLAAALGVSAYPSAHAHVKAHRSLQERDTEFVKSVRPTARDSPVTTTGSFCNGNSGTFTPNGGSAVPCTTVSKRATEFDVKCYGNLGAQGDYGCNLKKIEEEEVSSYKHVVTIENTSGQTQHCAFYFKISAGGEPNGFFNGKEVLKVEIPVGSSQHVAVDDDTQGGAACGPGDDVPLTSWGQFAGTWAEFDFSSKKNNLWSGADASSLVAASNNLPITPMSISSKTSDIISSITAAGTGVNAFTAGMELLNGRGFNIGPGPFSINVQLS